MFPLNFMGFRIAATAIIWGFATGMMAITIPLISLTDSGITLPLAIMIATTISTLGVWLNFGSNQ